MKKILLIFFIFGFLFLNNCSKNEKIEILEIEEDKIEGQMIKAYQEGMDAFKNQFYVEVNNIEWKIVTIRRLVLVKRKFGL